MHEVSGGSVSASAQDLWSGVRVMHSELDLELGDALFIPILKRKFFRLKGSLLACPKKDIKKVQGELF